MTCLKANNHRFTEKVMKALGREVVCLNSKATVADQGPF